MEPSGLWVTRPRVLATAIGHPGKASLIAENAHTCSRMLGWSADNKELVVSLDGQVRVYRRRTGAHRVLADGTHPSWSPDGRWIAFQPRQGKAALINVTTGSRKDILSNREILYGMQWSPDSRYLLYCDRQRHIWGDTSLGVYRLKDGVSAPTRVQDSRFA
ncbi:MAG: PD40 domain-containing protein [Candidatus Hydrogenedentes bacterium]|nr:PD40 domain-containing protein [Candidatus Hydrogenedentota bacterium]